jgi:hypothetical protein
LAAVLTTLIAAAKAGELDKALEPTAVSGGRGVPGTKKMSL